MQYRTGAIACRGLYLAVVKMLGCSEIDSIHNYTQFTTRIDLISNIHRAYKEVAFTLCSPMRIIEIKFILWYL